MGARAKQQEAFFGRLTDQEKVVAMSKRPTERFRAQGFAILPFGIFSHAHKFAPGGAQLLAVQYVVFSQFSSQETPEWVKVSPAALSELTGGAYTQKSFDLALTDAAKRGLVEREKRGRDWWYRVFPEDWGAVADYEPLVPVEVPRPAKAERAPADALDSQIVAAGKKARPVKIAMKVEVPGAAPVDFDFKFELRNDGGVPLSSRSYVEAGVLVCTVADAAKRTEGERSSSALLENATRKRKTPGVSSSTLLENFNPTQSNQRDSEFRDAIESIALERFHHTPDAELVARILTAAGPSLPASEFHARVISDIDSLIRKRKPVETGMLVWSAGEARRKWDADAPKRAAAASAKPAAPETMSFAAFLSEWNHPDRPPSLRDALRDSYPDLAARADSCGVSGANGD